jgi:NAD(P)-dependent dehydrogenase (short-subunit alcohol dehydrogenase family)
MSQPLRALVTGASSGIGMATARLIHARGGSVALVARRAEVLDELAAELGERATPIACDVADPAAVAAVVAQAFDALGGLDLVVNAAGVCMPVSLAEMTPATWDTSIGINLTGTFWVSREAALRMSAGGSIVNLGSEQSFIGMGLYVDYAASKFGVLGITKAMAAELAPRGIRVNAICPGPVATPMVEAELRYFQDPEAVRIEGTERVPLKRWAAPEEIADAILCLATTPYATGSAWSVDGGTTAI